MRWTGGSTGHWSQPSPSTPDGREAIMASDELSYATIRDIGARLRRRALSPVELTRALLERIERLDPGLHAFVTVTADRPWRTPRPPKPGSGPATSPARSSAFQSA